MLKALGVCGNNPFRVQNGHGELDPGLSLALQPWADISQRLRRFNLAEISQRLRRSNPGLS